MSDTENRESTPAPQGEAIAATPIAIHADAAAPAAPATPKTRIADSSLEAAHADLPPLSSLGDTTPAAQPADSTAASTGNGARRGRGRGAPAGGFGAPATTKTPIGAVENPAEMTESLSGKFVTGYTDTKPAPVRPAPVKAVTEAPEAAVDTAPKAVSQATPEAAPKAAESTGFKEFVPPVSEGTFKADLNPEAERKAREERRQQREQRPQGDRAPREPRPQGGEFRGPREPRQQQQGERPRDERRQGGERPQGDRRHDDRRQGTQGGEGRPERTRPGRLTIEAPKMPVQQDLSLFGKIKRFFAEKFYGVPSPEKLEHTSVTRQPTPHSREWQFGRNRQGGDNRQGNRAQGNGGEFRQNNRQQGGEFRGNRGDSRHRPHPRGGNHRDQHGRDGNPRG